MPAPRTPPWPPGEVIAHRGGALEAPENTVRSVAHGVAAGSHWQEVDLTLSADDEVVVIHDDTLERTTNGTGEVARTPWSRLSTLRAHAAALCEAQVTELARWGCTPAARDPEPQPLPRLSDILAVPGTNLMLELKDGPRPGRLVERVAAVLTARGRRQRVALASFSPDILRAAARALPHLTRIGIAQSEAELAAVCRLAPTLLAVHKDLLPVARNLGARVWTWTVCCPAEAKALFAAGAHGVITDAPKAVMAGVTAHDLTSETQEK